MTAEAEETIRGLREDARYPWRNQNLGRLLLTAVRSWQDALVEGLRQAGFSEFTTTHMNLLRYIDLTGTRITEIAERAGITKQAVGQLVTACTALDLLTIRPDPTDGRAKIVTYTKKGEALILAQLSIMKRLDVELDALLGPSDHRKLREILMRFPLDLTDIWSASESGNRQANRYRDRPSRAK